MTDGALVVEVRLVTDQHDGDFRIGFYARQLALQGCEFGERVGLCDGEDEEEAVAGFHVEFAHGGWGVGCD